MHITALEVQQPDRLAIAHLPIRQKTGTPVKAMRTFVLGVDRQPDLITTRTSSTDMSQDEWDRR